MAGRTSAQAVQAFVDPLQLALSCVTDAVVNIGGGYHPADEPHALTLGDGSPVRLRGDPPLALSVILHYRIVRATGQRGLWRVQAIGYLYALEDPDGREVLAYHWHPLGHSAVLHPHLHLGAGARVGFPRLSDAHLPTGWVALEAVLRLAVADLGVEPRRADWDEVLRRTQKALEQW
ncbi:MAG: hypothetical protein HY718_08385 [Planctomycetes bacterium]|nr:hypothetical protein [Planctomycetota bacterium]